MNDKTPKESRRERLKPTRGMWTFLSMDLGRLIKNEIVHSKQRDNPGHKNQVPIYTIPLIPSFIRALAIEIENIKERYTDKGYKSKLIESLQINPTNELVIICGFYRIQKELKESASLFNHVRHEILHTSPYPEDGSSLPKYLRELEKIGVLWKPFNFYTAHNILDYFCSHKLLAWGATILLEISDKILESNIASKELESPYRDILKEIQDELSKA
jgi:hypothetical protein